MRFWKKIIQFIAIALLLPAIVSAASFLENEAGISASAKLDSADLTLAETAFKNVEKRTAGYIIGSIAIDGYDEAYDVHVYIDTSGEMVAYYLKDEKASKIIDWISYEATNQVTGSKLEIALAKVCNVLFTSLPQVTYFDFRYPDAKNIKIITDEVLEPTDTEEIETFRCMIPSDHTVYNITWSHVIHKILAHSTYVDFYLKMDNEDLHFQRLNPATGSWMIWEGDIPTSQFTPDVFHEFTLQNLDYRVNSYAGIVLIYNEAE